MQNIKALEKKFGYTFKNTKLLEQALTHRSAGNLHYERLEFLGDSVLGMVISNELFLRFPDATEGELTRLRSQIVRGETLAEMSIELGLGEYISFGPGELKSGSRHRASILADIFESIVGAIYIDSDFQTVENIILKICATALIKSHPQKILKDPKTRIQEYLQGRGIKLPDYQIEEVSGPAHAQQFKVQARIESLNIAVQGSGSSRKNAEQDAAEKMYQRVTHD